MSHATVPLLWGAALLLMQQPSVGDIGPDTGVPLGWMLGLIGGTAVIVWKAGKDRQALVSRLDNIERKVDSCVKDAVCMQRMSDTEHRIVETVKNGGK